jgi:membrane protease YdiL (CAAX protease family)
MNLVKEAKHVEKANAMSPSAAIVAVAVTFVLALFLGAAVILAFGDAPAVLLSATVISELLIIGVPFTYMLLRHVDIKSYVGLDIKPQFILLGIASGVLLLLLDVFVTSVLTAVFGVSQAVEESNSMLTNLSGSTPGLIFVIISLPLAGVCEEFMFRGFLQNTINRRYGFIPAVIVSSIAWGLFHFDPQLVYTLSIIIAGLVLGYIYHRSNSYVVSAIAHSTLNLIVLAFLLLAI